MSIENDLNRIANALEALANRGNVNITQETPVLAMATAVLSDSPAPKKAGRPAKSEKPAPVVEIPDAVPTVTKDEVTDALREVVVTKKQAVALEILRKHGAGRVSELDPSKYADVLADLKQALK